MVTLSMQCSNLKLDRASLGGGRSGNQYKVEVADDCSDDGMACMFNNDLRPSYM